jgi:GNAT superfamily N-acetyltransferase
VRIHPLRPEDDRAHFTCGESVLDRFLREFALQNTRRHGVGPTYVAEESGIVLGYVTVAACSLDADTLPDSLRASLPSYPLPALRLARLAVDERAHGRGIGTALVGAAADIALEMAERVGCVGIIADAKPDAVGFYERLGFVALDAERGASAARPRQRVLFLSLRAIRRATVLPEHHRGDAERAEQDEDHA